MEHKLTAQIAGVYWDSNIKLPDSDDTYVMQALKMNSICVGNNYLGIPMWYKISSCNLLLYRLEDITDEHACEVARIFNEQYLSTKGDKPTVNKGKIWINSRNQNCITDAICAVEISGYLRSKSYDCGYGSIPSLIDAGIAIDKKTLLI